MIKKILVPLLFVFGLGAVDAIEVHAARGPHVGRISECLDESRVGHPHLAELALGQADDGVIQS